MLKFYKKYKTEILILIFWTLQFYMMVRFFEVKITPKLGNSPSVPDVQVFISAGGDTLRYHAKAQEIYIVPNNKYFHWSKNDNR